MPEAMPSITATIRWSDDVAKQSVIRDDIAREIYGDDGQVLRKRSDVNGEQAPVPGYAGPAPVHERNSGRITTFVGRADSQSFQPAFAIDSRPCGARG